MIKRGIFMPLLVAAVAGAIVVASSIELRSKPSADDSLRAQFYAEYDAYLKAPPPDAFSSVSYSRDQAVHLGKIAHMGPAILPFLIDEARRTHDMNLTLPLGIITRVSLRHAGWPGAEDIGAREEVQLFIDWWDAGQARTDQMFADAYAAHDTLRMASLGMAALPRAMEKLDAGDDSMLEVVGKITKPMVSENVAADAATCHAWWQANKRDMIVPFPDQEAGKP
jgi:hypothetical protein